MNTIKNKLSLTTIIIALTITPLISGAQNSDVASVEDRNTEVEELREKARAELEVRKQEFQAKRESVKAEIEARRETFKTEMENRQEGDENKVEQRRTAGLANIRERLQNFAERIGERFDAAINRLDKLAERIASRIEKMDEADYDTAEAKSLLEVAKLKIETAKSSVASVGTNIEVILSEQSDQSETIKNDMSALRTEISKAKDDIKAAHVALIEVVRHLKSLSPTAGDNTTDSSN